MLILGNFGQYMSEQKYYFLIKIND